MDANAARAWNNHEIPQEDIITIPKSGLDKLAMINDLQYEHAGKVAKGTRKMKHRADLDFIRGNINNILDTKNKNVFDKVQHIASIPTFLVKILGETAYGSIKGEGWRIC